MVGRVHLHFFYVHGLFLVFFCVARGREKRFPCSFLPKWNLIRVLVCVVRCDEANQGTFIVASLITSLVADRAVKKRNSLADEQQRTFFRSLHDTSASHLIGCLLAISIESSLLTDVSTPLGNSLCVPR